MKKTLVVAGVCAAAVAYLGTVYIVDRFDQDLSRRHLAESALQDGSTLDREAFQVIMTNGCGYCHTRDSEMPFYANLPVAKQLMAHDVAMAQRQFNMEALLQNMQKGEPVSEVDLAKIEGVLQDGSMPPKLYLSMHWRSNLSEEERQTLLDWVKLSRSHLHPAGIVAAQHRYELVQPITTVFAVDEDKVALGKDLFHDTRLSGDNTLSCASCHGLDQGGVDSLDTSTGINGAKGPINAPTVFNAVFNTHQFWDGRAADLQEQAGGPPMNPIEMGSVSWTDIVNKLAADATMKTRFSELYPDEGITANSITDAIAEFEKTLVTPDSRFDLYLKGDDEAITAEEKAGYALFKEYKCATCHVGEAMGGQSFELMGIKDDYFADRATDVTEADHGRYNVTQQQGDMHRFKTPTLRNVALTAPYFHDASARTLEEAVVQMARYQVGVELSEDEVKKITAFLHTLTGKYQGEYLQY